jgi:hypothetical protein
MNTHCTVPIQVVLCHLCRELTATAAVIAAYNGLSSSMGPPSGCNNTPGKHATPNLHNE